MLQSFDQVNRDVWDNKIALATSSHLAGGLGLGLLLRSGRKQRPLAYALLGYCLASHAYAWLTKKPANMPATRSRRAAVAAGDKDTQTLSVPGNEPAVDATLALLRDPYRYISKQSRKLGTDIFETRLLLRKTTFMTGSETAELFYDENRFSRQGAMPGRIQKTLLGKGGVQGLDGEAHRHRKAMFLSLMTPERVTQLGNHSADCWESHAQKWEKKEHVVLYDEVCELLTRAVCRWAEVPLGDHEVALRARELTAMFDYAGSVGPKHWQARVSRKQSEVWIQDIIQQIRAGQLSVSHDSAAHVIAWHRDLNGQLLDPRIAAVELINVLRPTVAVAVFIVQIAHALHMHPDIRRKLQSDDPEYLESFVQEVRRYYPFFPAVAARVKDDFEWKGYQFPKGRLVLFDLYGTNHDPRAWDAPMEFQAERFLNWDKSPYTFVPQGGGDHHLNHRCPGEWIAIELMKVATRFLSGRLTYSVPDQDLEINYTRLPAIPRDKFIVHHVRMDKQFVSQDASNSMHVR